MRVLGTMSIAAAILVASPAAAQTLVNFDTDPNGVAISTGTRITNQYASVGVTFSLFENGVEVGPGGLASNAFAGTNELYNTAGDVFPITGANRADVLRFSFSGPASGVSFLVNGFDVPVQFQAYNANGTLIESQLFNSIGYNTVTFASGGIARIDGLQTQDDYAFRVDDLRFNIGAAPEPATWMMMIGGFGAVGVALRRRRRQAAADTGPQSVSSATRIA